MANEDAVFKFGADTRPVDSALDGLTGKITDFGKTAGIALAGIFAAQKLVGFFNDSTAAALESEKAVKQFNFALKAAGVFTEEASKGFQSLPDRFCRRMTASSSNPWACLIAAAAILACAKARGERRVPIRKGLCEVNSGTVMPLVHNEAGTYGKG